MNVAICVHVSNVYLLIVSTFFYYTSTCIIIIRILPCVSLPTLIYILTIMHPAREHPAREHPLESTPLESTLALTIRICTGSSLCGLSMLKFGVACSVKFVILETHYLFLQLLQ